MDKLEELVTEVFEKDLKEGRLNIAKYGSNCFRTGVLWLLDKAKTVALASMNETTTRRQPDMRAIDLVRELEKLCQSEDDK